MSNESFEKAEAEALVQTKDLLATGRHRARATLPVVRLSGPLLESSGDTGINLYSLIKRPPPRAPVTKSAWPVSSFYPAEV